MQVRQIKTFKTWLVQLATRTKWKVLEIVKECEVNLNGFLPEVNLNILPLGSYDIIIGMDWLEKHHVYYREKFLCLGVPQQTT